MTIYSNSATISRSCLPSSIATSSFSSLFRLWLSSFLTAPALLTSRPLASISATLSPSPSISTLLSSTGSSVVRLSPSSSPTPAGPPNPFSLPSAPSSPISPSFIFPLTILTLLLRLRNIPTTPITIAKPPNPTPSPIPAFAPADNDDAPPPSAPGDNNPPNKSPSRHRTSTPAALTVPASTVVHLPAPTSYASVAAVTTLSQYTGTTPPPNPAGTVNAAGQHVAVVSTSASSPCPSFPPPSLPAVTVGLTPTTTPVLTQPAGHTPGL
ncbi:hypothetical protein BR93DRAFT_940618 [Coniochaeta sp. PMI_546]|nr:hypothetical protein BR93DRAFT_940618 [Coniochaeta sp. PMI_546]